MTSKSLIAVLSAAGGVAIALFFGWPLHQGAEANGAPSAYTASIAHLAVVWDSSPSSATSCSEVLELAQRQLKLIEAAPDTEGVNICLFATGATGRGLEPRLVSNTDLVKPAQIINSTQRYSQERLTMFSQMRSRCQETSRSKSSPIYLALKRAAEHLHAAGCGPRLANCVLAGSTDGQETQAFDWHALAGLPLPIDNTGIVVKLCGLAQSHLANSTEVRASNRLGDVWKSLFTARELVSFDPFCPE